MLFTANEILDAIIIILAIGFIFKDMFKKPTLYEYDPLAAHNKLFDLDNLKFAAMAVAPAIIFHELGHKFVGLFFGLDATFHAAYFWLILGVVLKLMNFGFIFFVPAYVSLSCTSQACMAMVSANPWILGLVAFAGPFVNLLLWMGSLFIIKRKLVNRKYMPLLHITKTVNMLLFIFNMLPIPGFDGSKVFLSLFQTFI